MNPGEQLSEKSSISVRYLAAIENENRKPSFDVLYTIVCELGIVTDIFFFPEMQENSSDKEQLIHEAE